jgi:predicted transcriptional regulator
MARAALQWSVLDLADVSHVSKTTIVRFENGKIAPIHSTLAALQRTFEEAGIEFLEGEGVRPARRT